MANGKIIFNNETLIDLTSDTITADKLVKDETAHNAAGETIVGSLVVSNFYTGSSTPTSSIGNDGDLYLVTEE